MTAHPIWVQDSSLRALLVASWDLIRLGGFIRIPQIILDNRTVPRAVKNRICFVSSICRIHQRWRNSPIDEGQGKLSFLGPNKERPQHKRRSPVSGIFLTGVPLGFLEIKWSANATHVYILLHIPFRLLVPSCIGVCLQKPSPTPQTLPISLTDAPGFHIWGTPISLALKPRTVESWFGRKITWSYYAPFLKVSSRNGS